MEVNVLTIWGSRQLLMGGIVLPLSITEEWRIVMAPKLTLWRGTTCYDWYFLLYYPFFGRIFSSWYQIVKRRLRCLNSMHKVDKDRWFGINHFQINPHKIQLRCNQYETEPIDCIVSNDSSIHKFVTVRELRIFIVLSWIECAFYMKFHWCWILPLFTGSHQLEYIYRFVSMGIQNNIKRDSICIYSFCTSTISFYMYLLFFIIHFRSYI